MLRKSLLMMVVCGYVATFAASANADTRVSASKKGSIIYYSKVELKWNAAGALTQDTFITIVNDYPADVFVQWYFVNGDAPTAAVFNAGLLVERAHRGWNWADCNTLLSHDESNYMSMARGTPLGCQPFTILDSGSPQGRPDADGPAGSRVLRGFVVAFAVDNTGHEISWNHLSGHADIVNYSDRSAWEYNGFAFQCLANATPGATCGTNNILDMNGTEYDSGYAQLLFDFYAVGSTAFSLGTTVVTLDTDLTLYPVSADLRQDNDGPITTKAKIDIWNQNEDGFSGSIHCITCWDQTLLSNYAATNNFLIGNIHTDKGKARIDGMASSDCDPVGSCCNLSTDPDCFPSANHPAIDQSCSEAASLLGVSDKILVFSGAVTGRTDAGMTLVGQGIENAQFKWDIVLPPQPLQNDPNVIVPVQVDVEETIATPRTFSRGQRQGKD